MSGDKLPIVEADEIAAEKVLDALLVATEPEMLSPEECEAEIVQAFARHRIAAETKAATTITELVSALEAIENGEIERPVGEAFRLDGKPSKHDRCTHGVWMYECCAGCIDAHIRTALSNTRGDKNEQE